MKAVLHVVNTDTREPIRDIVVSVRKGICLLARAEEKARNLLKDGESLDSHSLTLLQREAIQK